MTSPNEIFSVGGSLPAPNGQKPQTLYALCVELPARSAIVLRAFRCGILPAGSGFRPVVCFEGPDGSPAMVDNAGKPVQYTPADGCEAPNTVLCHNATDEARAYRLTVKTPDACSDAWEAGTAFSAVLEIASV